MKIDMKKMNIGAFVVSGGLLLAASGCTESDFDSKYEDPSKVNQVTISNLMVGVFQKVNIIVLYFLEDSYHQIADGRSLPKSKGL